MKLNLPTESPSFLYIEAFLLKHFYFFHVSQECGIGSWKMKWIRRQRFPTAGNWNRMQITLVEAAAFKPKKTSEGTPQCLATPNMVKISLANGHV